MFPLNAIALFLSPSTLTVGFLSVSIGVRYVCNLFPVPFLCGGNLPYDPTVLGKDALDVILVGTQSPANFGGQAQSCTGVFAGERFFLVDAGDRVAARMGRDGFRLPLNRLDGVFLTHYHSDHIAGLGELRLRRFLATDQPVGDLPVYGPETGLKPLVEAVNNFYALDNIYRMDHHNHGDEVLLYEENTNLTAVEFEWHHNHSNSKDAFFDVDVGAVDEPVTVYQDAETGLTVSAVSVQHDPVAPAVGYRFDYKGRSVTFSGDTVYSPNLVQLATGSDTLIHESLGASRDTLRSLIENLPSRLNQLIEDVLDYHSEPAEAARVMKEAGVRTMVINHIAPLIAVPRWLQRWMLLEDVEWGLHNNIHVAYDGTFVHMPLSSTDVMVRKGGEPWRV